MSHEKRRFKSFKIKKSGVRVGFNHKVVPKYENGLPSAANLNFFSFSLCSTKTKITIKSTPDP